jgi:DHA2 family multidrug resistance protein
MLNTIRSAVERIDRLDGIGQQVQAQASFLGYMDAFWVLMLISLTAVPQALTLRKVKLGGPAPVH